MPMAERDVADRLRCVLEGEKGFDLLCASEFDPVISDFQMPGISGYESCRKIRSLEGAGPPADLAPDGTPISLAGRSKTAMLMKSSSHHDRVMGGQPLRMGRDTGATSADASPSPTHALLMELLDSSIVLVEDFDKLSDQAQDEISQCPGTKAMLGLLVQHGLLTEYQAGRVEAGTTYGLVLGSYRVLDRLGAGGMGVVFKAEHVDMRRPVAIKVLVLHGDHDPRIEQRFLREIRVVAQLQHPNIVAAMDAGKTSAAGHPTLRYFVMELVPGQDLEEYVNATGPISPAQACDIIHQVAAALVEADKHDLVHRDIKPANIRLTPDGQAKLLDFGLTRQFATRMTEPGTVLGTVDFMAPEQTLDAGSVDIRADIYALGGTLFWCLTGKTPFPAQRNHHPGHHFPPDATDPLRPGRATRRSPPTWTPWWPG